MRFRRVTSISAIALLVALAIPVRLVAQGKIIPIDAPGAGTMAGQGTTAIDINLVGAITGYYIDEYSVFHGFLRDPAGHFTTFNAPGADLTHGDFNGTFPLNINQEGAISGYYVDATGLYHGFLRSPGGTFTTFNAPGAGTGSGQGTGMAGTIGLNDLGAIEGNYLDANNVFHGYVRAPNGTIITFNAPGAGTGEFDGTIGSGINDLGAAIGAYTDQSGVNHGYVRAPFGAITTFNAPGAGTGSGQGTLAEGINLEGAITGEYIDSGGVSHGFLLSPNGTFITFNAPGAGTLAGQGTVGSTNNDLGALVGYYIDVNGVNHGFLRNP
jgi:hypothetical protein